MNLERLKKLPLVQQEPKLDESIDKALQEAQKIARASEKAGVLVGDLLAYSKPTQIVLIPLPLHELVLDMINAIKSHPQFSQFTITFDNETDRLVQCDRVKLEQVFYNLIKNACDATDGKGTAHIYYTEHLENDKPFVVAHVKDNGPGIDKTNIARIFDPFFTTKGHSGVGLGLSICYRTIEQHGGLLSVESVKWEGTEFKVSLPVYLEIESGKRSGSP
jgi:two-component system NtrC family sensor kinase